VSKHSVNQVIQRAIGDAAFRRQLQRDPANALQGFDLTKDERAAITSGDPTRLTALGVDQRMSKAFGLGGMSDVSKTVAGDDTVTGGGAAFLDEGSSAGTASLVSPNTAEGGNADLLIPGTASAGTGVFVDADGTTLDAGHADPNAQAGTAVIDAGTAQQGTGVFVDSDGTTLDAGVVSTDGAGNAVIVGDPASPTTSAVESLDTTGDMNLIDPGLVSSRATDFIDVGDGSSGDLNVIDPGLVGGGQAGFDPGDLNTDASALDSASGGLDTGGDIRPTEY
jgi:hypothetical protein